MSDQAAGSAVACAICASDCEASKAVRPDCGHGFCRECLARWSRQSSRCPLCQREFVRVQLSNGESIAIEVLRSESEVVDEPEGPADLMGLDHAYFADEIARLQAAVDEALARIQTAQRQRSASRFGSNRGGPIERQTLAALEAMSDTLAGLQEQMLAEARFDPNGTLDILYDMDARLFRMREDPIGWNRSESDFDHGPAVLGADDWDAQDGGDDDDDDDDGYGDWGRDGKGGGSRRGGRY